MIYKKESNEYVKDGKAIYIVNHFLFNKLIYQTISYTTNIKIRDNLGENTTPNNVAIKGFSND